MSVPNPGSREAMKSGCTCPMIDNHHGNGYRSLPGLTPVFIVDPSCPMHKHRPCVTCWSVLSFLIAIIFVLVLALGISKH